MYEIHGLLGLHFIVPPDNQATPTRLLVFSFSFFVFLNTVLLSVCTFCDADSRSANCVTLIYTLIITLYRETKLQMIRVSDLRTPSQVFKQYNNILICRHFCENSALQHLEKTRSPFHSWQGLASGLASGYPCQRRVM